MTNNHFDLSIIILHKDKNYGGLKKFLQQHLLFFQENGVEIILISYSEEVLNLAVKFIDQHPFFNWILIHANPRTEIELFQLGVNYSNFARLIFLETNFDLTNDTFYNFNRLSLNYSVSGIIGHQKHIRSDINLDPYGVFQIMFFIMKDILSNALTKISNGEELNNSIELIRLLQYNDVKLMVVNNAFDLCNKKNIKTNHSQNYFSNSFSNILYSYQNKNQLRKYATDFFQTFEDFSIVNFNVFNKKHNVIALVSIYNERKHLKDFLSNLSQNCDGMIILDDGSNDDSYEHLLNKKLLLKVKKLRDGFNDLENRNILLKLSFFFNTNWILFMDADERISKNFGLLKNLTSNKNADVFSLNFVNLWDNKNHFRADMQEAKNHNIYGVYKRYRLFRNIGFSRIKLGDDRKLHFPTVPYFNKICNSSLLVYHLGTLDPIDRINKYNFYKQSDKWVTKNNYAYLLDSRVVLRKTSTLTLDQILNKNIYEPK